MSSTLLALRQRKLVLVPADLDPHGKWPSKRIEIAFVACDMCDKLCGLIPGPTVFCGPRSLYIAAEFPRLYSTEFDKWSVFNAILATQSSYHLLKCKAPSCTLWKTFQYYRTFIDNEIGQFGGTSYLIWKGSVQFSYE